MPPENNVAPVQSHEPIPEPIIIEKIGKFAASRLIVKESLAILKQDKEIMWFPVVSSITSLIAIAFMGMLYFFIILGGNTVVLRAHEALPSNDFVGYGMLLIYYIVMLFIFNFFQAGLFLVVQARFEGKDLSFADGINGAKDNINKIFIWSVIAGTVGVILQIISDKSKLVGKIVASLLGAAWNILTYFSLPSLIIGQKDVKESFKESAAIIRKTWGETIIVQFGVGLVFVGIYFLALAIAVGIIVLAPTATVVIPVLILLAITVVILGVLSSTLGSIFKLALYNFARTGKVPQGFSPSVIYNAIKR